MGDLEEIHSHGLILCKDFAFRRSLDISRQQQRFGAIGQTHDEGIVVLRGRTADHLAAEQVAVLAQGLGYARVANLIQITQPVDDIAIERLAERQLGMSRGLEGCQFHIDSDNGVVRLNGTVKYELQKDMAAQIVRGINGVKSVQLTLQK